MRSPFLPLRTARLVIRPLGFGHVDAFVAYRNDPEVARHQDWDLPYPTAEAIELADAQAHIDEPIAGAWTQLAIELSADHAEQITTGGELVGDVAVFVDADLTFGLVGYTLARGHQGRGYATEAVAAVVDRLFDDFGLRRIAASVDPANVPSARVLERIGFTHEGTAANAVRVRGEVADDDRYGLLPDQRVAWRERPMGPPAQVELVEITPDNQRTVAALATHRSQEEMVAPVLVSYADALFPRPQAGHPVAPWLRAIYADGEPVGFVMVTDLTEHEPVPYLWRMLIDRRHQRRGIGERAVRAVMDDFRRRGATEMEVSFIVGRGGPEPFYAKLGFERTGKFEGDEHLARVSLI